MFLFPAREIWSWVEQSRQIWHRKLFLERITTDCPQFHLIWDIAKPSFDQDQDLLISNWETILKFHYFVKLRFVVGLPWVTQWSRILDVPSITSKFSPFIPVVLMNARSYSQFASSVFLGVPPPPISSANWRRWREVCQGCGFLTSRKGRSPSPAGLPRYAIRVWWLSTVGQVGGKCVSLD